MNLSVWGRIADLNSFSFLKLYRSANKSPTLMEYFMESKKNFETSMLGLISVLLDKTAREDERDDAAMDLWEYNDDRAIEALSIAGSDPTEDDMVRASAGNSLAEIFCERNKFDKEIYDRLISLAQHEAFLIIKSRKPEWITRYGLEEDI